MHKAGYVGIMLSISIYTHIMYTLVQTKGSSFSSLQRDLYVSVKTPGSSLWHLTAITIADSLWHLTAITIADKSLGGCHLYVLFCQNKF